MSSVGRLVLGKQVKSKQLSCDHCRKKLDRLDQHLNNQLTDTCKNFILSTVVLQCLRHNSETSHLQFLHNLFNC